QIAQQGDLEFRGQVGGEGQDIGRVVLVTVLPIELLALLGIDQTYGQFAAGVVPQGQGGPAHETVVVRLIGRVGRPLYVYLNDHDGAPGATAPDAGPDGRRPRRYTAPADGAPRPWTGSGSSRCP